MNLSIFAERLNELVFDKNITPENLAKELGLGRTMAYNYLAGRNTPSLERLIRIADYFSCSVDFLVGLEVEPNFGIYHPAPPFKIRLFEVCKHYGITRYKLQKMTGIGETQFYYWSIGKSEPSIDNLLRLCEKLDCSMDFLLGRV